MLYAHVYKHLVRNPLYVGVIIWFGSTLSVDPPAGTLIARTGLLVIVSWIIQHFLNNAKTARLRMHGMTMAIAVATCTAVLYEVKQTDGPPIYATLAAFAAMAYTIVVIRLPAPNQEQSHA